MVTMIEMIAEAGIDHAGAFVGRCDNGAIRIGFKGVGAVTANHPAFLALAAQAATLMGDDLADAVADAMRAAARSCGIQ